jgi:hypothetical protein
MFMLLGDVELKTAGGESHFLQHSSVELARRTHQPLFIKCSDWIAQDE